MSMEPPKDYYDQIGENFAAWIHPFDMRSRLEWFDRQLTAYSLTDEPVLDIGAGLGPFSELIERHGGRPIPLDIGVNLSHELSQRFGRALVGDAVHLPLKEEALSWVLSSECIEHTPDPTESIREMARVLAPGGRLFLSTPNRVWRWAVSAARVTGLRHFSGMENWLSRRTVRRTLEEAGMRILVEEGLYLLPFQVAPLRAILSWTNRRAQFLRGMMINQCWVAEKV